MGASQEGSQVCPLVCALASQDGVVPDGSVNGSDGVLGSAAVLVLEQRHLAHAHQSQSLVHVRLHQEQICWKWRGGFVVCSGNSADASETSAFLLIAPLSIGLNDLSRNLNAAYPESL